MKTKSKFFEFLADIVVKIFQIIFAMLVVGMFLRERFNNLLFVFGLFVSGLLLLLAVALYYNGTIKGEE